MSNEIEPDKTAPFAEFFDYALTLNPEKRFSSASEMKEGLINLDLFTLLK